MTLVSYSPVVKSSGLLEVLLGFNAFTTIEQVSKRFPIVGNLKYLFIPLSAVRSMKEMNQTSHNEIEQRIKCNGNREEFDFFEQLMPADGMIPTDPKEFRHMEMVTMQLLFAGFEPISSWYYGTIFYLLKEPKFLETLTREVRGRFDSYADISADSLASLEYLNGCLEESMRLFPSNNTGLPRVSPGAMVSGTYVPKGVSLPHTMSITDLSVQISLLIIPSSIISPS